MTFKMSTPRRSGRWDELPARQLFGRRWAESSNRVQRRFRNRGTESLSESDMARDGCAVAQSETATKPHHHLVERYPALGWRWRGGWGRRSGGRSRASGAWITVGAAVTLTRSCILSADNRYAGKEMYQAARVEWTARPWLGVGAWGGHEVDVAADSFLLRSQAGTPHVL